MAPCRTIHEDAMRSLPLFIPPPCPILKDYVRKERAFVPAKSKRGCVSAGERGVSTPRSPALTQPRSPKVSDRPAPSITSVSELHPDFRSPKRYERCHAGVGWLIR